MESKEIKLALKSVKENLNAKDYKSAIKQCKSILKNDRNNYLALVFFGAALQETEHKDEASKVFKKAIEIKPENNLAWRGLASYYEKFQTPESNEELLKAYERLIVLETEPIKYGEFIKKYEELGTAVRDEEVLKRLCSSLNGMADVKSSMLKQSLLLVLLTYPDSDKEIHEYKKSLLTEFVSAGPCVKDHLTVCKKYLELLYNDGSLSHVVIEGSKVQINYPKNREILEYICKAYAELYCLSDNNLSSELSCKEAYSALLELTPDSYLGHLCEGISKLEVGDPLTAIDSLHESVKENPSFGLSWYVLSKCQVLLYQFVDLERSAQEALKCIKKESKNEKLISVCELWLIQSFSEQDSVENWSKAVNLGKSYYENKSHRKEDVLPYLVKALIRLNQTNECNGYLDEMRKNNYETVAEYLECLRLKQVSQLDECKMKLERLTNDNPECFEAWLELGKMYYIEKNGNSCLSCLLKSAKLNQWCYLSFLHLGHCYKDLLNNLEMARRCYQKAFQLNPASSESGHCLSDVYLLLGKEDLNCQLLSLITSQSPKQKWGWVNLGIHYLSLHQYQNALNSLRVATRLDPDDRLAWEALADAYFYQGAYITAVKAYDRALELGSDPLYPQLQIAAIKHIKGEFDESISGYREIIEKNPMYLPALKGHAEVCITLAKQRLAQNMIGLAMDNYQEAVDSLIKCVEMRSDLVCVWKLLGDSCVHFANLPRKYCRLRVSSAMIKDKRLREGQKVGILGRLDVLKLASRCYTEALSLDTDSSSLWYDLAVAYNHMAVLGDSPEYRKDMRNLACCAVKKSLLVNEKNWESWNLFGIISASSEVKDYPLAQHCFIRSLEENATNSVVWTNLGTLYLCLKDFKLANQSFREAQRLDHDYVQCWIGQAMIANATGHYDAMDLFRHSNQLATHPEGCLGYANLVCQMLLETKDKTDRNYIYSIKNMNAIAVACDCLTWYTDRIPDDPCAFNMLGLLLERQKLYNSSCKAFNAALSLLMTSPTGENRSEMEDKVLLNYGRILVKIGRAEEAIAVMKKIRTANFVNQCGLAEAYFNAKQYEEAYNAYATTLEWLAPDSGFKSHILVAMAAVVYIHQGKEDAKILLMQASQLKPPSVQGLFACCALGMLHSDLSLSELSLKELSQYRDDSRYLTHIAVFESYMYLFKGEKEKAVRVLGKSIHRHPDQPSLWLSLSHLLLNLHPSFGSKSAANCAEVTIKLGRSEINVSKIMSLVSLSNLLSGKGLKSLRSAQKAVHMFPHETENWVVLVASVMSKCLSDESSRELIWLKKTIAYVRRKLESSKALSQWLSNNERKVAVMTDALTG